MSSNAPSLPILPVITSAEAEAMEQELARYDQANIVDQPDSQPDSPWSSEPQSYGSLTLPPINPDHNPDHIPSLDDPQFFENFFEPYSDHNSYRGNEQPPPSNQQARPSLQRSSSQFGVSNEDYLDFFNWDFTPPPEMDPTSAGHTLRTTRSSASSVVDLTASSPTQNNKTSGKKRKADSSTEERAKKTARPGSSSSVDLNKEAVVDLVDLSAVEDESQYAQLRAKEQAELLKLQALKEANKPVKLAEFQCIICMDNPTDLTVTHCGHLFCSECLHQALHAGDKKCCPVCRTNISMGRPGSKMPKNGVFVLEMKLMTANKKGKRPMNTL